MRADKPFLFSVLACFFLQGIAVNAMSEARVCDDSTPCDDSEALHCSLHFKKELLYWTTHEDGLAFTNKSSDVLTSNNFTKSDSVHPNFHWEYGFRLQGWLTPRATPVILTGTWTRLASKAKGVQKADDVSDFRGMYPIWSMSLDTLPGDYASAARMRWDLHTNLLDADAGYLFTIAENLSMNPFVGIRCAILNQKLHVGYTGGSFFNGTDRNIIGNDFTGIGPRLGAIVSYCLFDSVTLCGLAALNPLYGYFKTSHKETYLGAERFRHSARYHRLCLSVDYRIGVQWVGCLIEAWPAVAFGLFWEGHIFYRQNRMYRGELEFFKKNRDLMLQGFTFSASFSF